MLFVSFLVIVIKLGGELTLQGHRLAKIDTLAWNN